MTTPEIITHLEPHQIFVFGSNEAGRHGAGAAALAHQKFGAKYGVGFGPTGRCFAIPTKDWRVKTLPLQAVAFYIARFLDYAISVPSKDFLVTKIGCGLAGYSPVKLRHFLQSAGRTTSFSPLNLHILMTTEPKPLNPIAELLRKHQAQATSGPDFVRSVARKCNVHLSTAYAWLNGDKVPDGINTLNILRNYQ